jgi:hypothetical protein
VDPGEYARKLMLEARRAIEDEIEDCGTDTPVKVLTAAYERSSHLVGASWPLLASSQQILV